MTLLLSPPSARLHRPPAARLGPASFHFSLGLADVAELIGGGLGLALLGLVTVSLMRGGCEPLMILFAYLFA